MEFKNYSAKYSAKEKENIKKIRKVVSKYKKDASMFLGGVPMITSDMTDFIAQDIKKFGIGVFIFLVLILFVIFKSLRWIVIPLFGCVASVIFVSGLSGFIDWENYCNIFKFCRNFINYNYVNDYTFGCKI